MAADVLNIQEDTTLSPRVNYTDPIVRHDPTKQPTPVVKVNTNNRVVNTDKGANTFPVNPAMVEGCQIPIVRLETQNIISSNISYCKIDYTGFKPTLILDVYAPSGKDTNNMAANSVGGLGSTITVILTPRVDGQYKPISLDFTVKDVQYTDDMTHFEGEYKLPEMDRVQTKQWKHEGCTAKYCQTPKTPHPTTWKLLHDIAISLGLGYATTDHVKEIKDYKARLTHNETIEDTIEKHVGFGGLDNKSIFDSWIDLYNYLVVVNVPWVLGEEITWKDIGINPELDMGATDDNLPASEQIGMASRVLTNEKKHAAGTNMTFTHFQWIVDSKSQQNAGTTLNCFVGSPAGYGDGNNSISSTKCINAERSMDGITQMEKYNVERQEYLGNECCSDEDNNTPVLLQKQIHDRYLSNLRGKILEVTLDHTNFGLQRGTLVGVAIYDASISGKMNLVTNMENVDNKKDVHPKELSHEVARRINDSGTSIPNVSMSGYYYIDGMEFEYNGTDMVLTQRLFLIKKDPMINLQNRDTTYARGFSENISETPQS